MAEHNGLAGSVLGALAWKGRAHWVLTLYPDAREASGVWLKPGRQEPVGASAGGGADPERARWEAGRRARMKMRLYCVSNQLNRLGTLTYAGEGLHDPDELRSDVAEFFKRLRAGIKVKYLPTKHGIGPGDPFPYVWVPQWHPGGHGLHAHFAVGRYIPRGVIEAAWPHGFINIKLLSDLSTGSGVLEEARLAARYMAGYIGSQLDDERRRLGLHRYEVAQGFQPVEVKLHGRTADEVIERASQQLGAQPKRVWHSDSSKEAWHGPPACWAQWPA
jgi:hypothetical protein